MSTTFVCQQCGAPWQPDVRGACRFCRAAAAPPGTPEGVAGGRPRPSIDGDVLCRLLLAGTEDRWHPLDRLAASLGEVGGERFRATGSPVTGFALTLDDWDYQAWIDHGEVAALAVHSVRGVVLKRQPLPFDEWVACVAAHLAEYAGTHPRVYDAIVALDRP